MLFFNSFDEFVGIISQTTLQNKIPFNYDSDFIKLYFGKDKSRQISYRCDKNINFNHRYTVTATVISN
jgi:hypothetical protein